MKLRVLGLGDNVADFYTHINTIYPGGCSFNFSAYAAMQGADSAYLGIIGDDFAGRHIYKTAQDLNINTDRCRILHGETPLPAVKIENGERIFVGANEHGVWEKPLLITKKDLDYISSFDLVHTSLYSSMEQNLEIIAETGVPVSMDFGTTYSDAFFAYCCPNLTYAIMSCAHISMDQMHTQIENVHNFGTPYVIATRGAEGAWFSDHGNIYHRPAKMTEAVDTMGAGDSFLTTFLLNFAGHLKNAPTCSSESLSSVITDSLDAASSFSAKVCGMEGSFGYGTTYIPDEIID